MAELLSDILKRLQGRDPIEEDKLSNAAGKSKADYEQATGQGPQPDEEGIEETDYTPGGILDPDAKILGAIGGIGKAAVGAGRIARMAENGAPKAAAAAETKIAKGAWDKALRDPNALTQAVENPAAANAAYDSEQKAYRAAAQRTKDIREGTAIRQNTALPAAEPLDFKGIRPPPNVDARSEGDYALKWWDTKPTDDMPFWMRRRIEEGKSVVGNLKFNRKSKK